MLPPSHPNDKSQKKEFQNKNPNISCKDIKQEKNKKKGK